jgi:uncharacterized membrane protein YdjX (TVP38/TMEM64 family)
MVAVFAFPGMSMLELICGFVLGFTEGFIVSLISIVISSVAAFSLGRYFLRDHISAYLDQPDNTFKIFLKSIEQRNGLLLLILFRLMLIPMFVKNYGPSVIKTDFWTFVVAVIITTPPYVAIFTFLGSHAKSIADIAAGNATGDASLGWTQIVPIVVSILAGIVFTTLAYLEFKQIQERYSTLTPPQSGDPGVSEEQRPLFNSTSS